MIYKMCKKTTQCAKKRRHVLSEIESFLIQRLVELFLFVHLWFVCLHDSVRFFTFLYFSTFFAHLGVVFAHFGVFFAHFDVFFAHVDACFAQCVCFHIQNVQTKHQHVQKKHQHVQKKCRNGI